MTRPSEITRDRIFKAAERLFADRGYDATSVRAIVAKARVNQAAINYHFAGKDGLYREVLRAAFRALTEQQELWAIEQGFDEIVVKTKNRFYEMRGTLDHLRFEVVKYERNPSDNAESKVYLSKKLLPDLIRGHRSARTVVQVAI